MDEAAVASKYALSFREQLLLVAVAAPMAVFLLVLAPYLFTHYVVYKDAYLLQPPPPIGGPRALEGHWTDVPSAPVKPAKFGAAMQSFGWLSASDDLTTSVLPTAFGTIRQVSVKVGDSVVEGAPLFTVEPPGGKSDPADDQPPNIETAVIAAPVAGFITKLNVDVGTVIEDKAAAKTAPLASISDLSALVLAAEMDEDDARSLRPGDPIEVRPTSGPDRVFKGRILDVAPSADAGARRVAVRATVENPDAILRPNMFVRFARPGDENSEALAVPVSAVLFENDSARVWVVGADKARTLTPRAIRTGRIADGMVEVVDGLTADDQVATSETVFIDRAAKGY